VIWVENVFHVEIKDSQALNVRAVARSKRQQNKLPRKSEMVLSSQISPNGILPISDLVRSMIVLPT